HVAAARPDVAERKLELEVELLGGEELAQCGQRLSPSPGVANRPSALSLMSSKRSTERLQQNPSSRTAVALNFNPRRTGTGSQPTTTPHPFVQTTACIAVNLVPYRRAWPRVCPELCSGLVRAVRRQAARLPLSRRGRTFGWPKSSPVRERERCTWPSSVAAWI